MKLQEEYTQLDDLLSMDNNKFFVLEDQIDIDLQSEYFALSKKLKNQVDPDKAIADFMFMQDYNLSMTAKKHILAALASVERVEAYRLLEQYSRNPKIELKDWATLAYNESRMLMESSLSNEKQVFISTGMGGKGDLLRYFFALFPKDAEFSEFQQKFVLDEVEFSFKQNKSYIEKIDAFGLKYMSFVVLVPFKTSVEKLIKETFESCNQLGEFLDSKFIITNVKALNEEEVLQFALEEDLKLDSDDFEFDFDDYED